MTYTGMTAVEEDQYEREKSEAEKEIKKSLHVLKLLFEDLNRVATLTHKPSGKFKYDVRYLESLESTLESNKFNLSLLFDLAHCPTTDSSFRMSYDIWDGIPDIPDANGPMRARTNITSIKRFLKELNDHKNPKLEF